MPIQSSTTSHQQKTFRHIYSFCINIFFIVDVSYSQLWNNGNYVVTKDCKQINFLIFEILSEFLYDRSRKNEILSLITLPSCPNPWDLYSSLENKWRYFDEIRELSDPPYSEGATMFKAKRYKEHRQNSPCDISGSTVILWNNESTLVPLLSMQGQKAVGFCQKYLNLCSKDERRSYTFGRTLGWVINDRSFIFGRTIPLKTCTSVHLIDE